jgi:PAS domain S-box-containing protein
VIPRLPLALRAILLVLFALIPAGVVQALLEREVREERRLALGEEALRLTRLVAGQMDNTLEGARQTLSAMASHDAVIAARPSAACDDFLVRLVQRQDRYVTANLFRLDGSVICSATAIGPEVNVADRPYFREVLGGADFATGRYAIGRGTGRASLHLAAPLRDPSGGLVGVLAIALSLDWLNADIASLPLPRGSAIGITDADGIIIARYPQAERFTGQRLMDWQLELLSRPTAGVIDAPAIDGVRRLAGFSPPGEAPRGLFIAVGLDPMTTLAPLAARDRRAAALIIGSLLLALLLAMLAFHLAVNRPVRKLLDTAQIWARQDWTARLGSLAGGVEFARIGTALDAMAEAVNAAERARLTASRRVLALSEVSPQVVFTADAAGRPDWFNGYWRTLSGLSVPQSQGMGWLRAVFREDRKRVLAAWAASVEDARSGGEGRFEMELRLCRASDASCRWFLARAVPVRDADGRIGSWAGVALDVEELKAAQAEAARQAERLDATYRNAPAGLCLLDREFRFQAINARLAESNGAPPEAHLGRTLWEMAPQVADELAPRLRRLFATGEAQIFEVRSGPRQPGAPARDWLCHYTAMRGPDGTIVGASGSVLDITDRLQAEARERMLAREVDHRARNVLAVVRSLVRISVAEAGGNTAALVEALEGRIAAMARVHTVLAEAHWAAADLATLAAAETAAYGPQVRLDGAPVFLVPTAAQPFTLILHELATNAAKYGALSRASGSLDLRWWRDAEGVRLEWVEQGGPTLSGAPARSGFGTQLIDANAAPLDGTITRDWRPEGLRCELRIGPGALLDA